MSEPHLINNPLDRARDEAAIRRTMSQFFEATSDAVLFLDHEFVITFLNRRANEILAPLGNVIGTSFWEAFPQTQDRSLPYWDAYHCAMLEGTSTHFEAFYGAPLNLWFDMHVLPAEDGIILFFRDRTAGKANLQELEDKTKEIQRQYAEIESLYRTAPIGLALFSVPDFRYLRCNDRQASFFGLSPAELLGRTVTEMAPIEVVQQLFEQVAAGEPVIAYPLEGTLVGRPDHYGYWTCNYYPVRDASGTVVAISAASLEITQQKQAEQALIESEKLAAVGRLASSIAHEINNPLEAVTNLLYLARITPSVDDAHGYVREAEAELQRVAHITSQTLRFHKQATSPQEISAEELMTSVRSIYQGKLVNAGVTVEQKHRKAPAVRCFEGEIRQVISNLVGNALDALPLGEGRILLRSRRSRDPRTGAHTLTLTVADNGSGMDKQTVEKAFRPFYTTKGILGTGLGLWISDEIVQRHGGRLRVRSREGYGTVFNISLPYDAVTR